MGDNFFQSDKKDKYSIKIKLIPFLIHVPY